MDVGGSRGGNFGHEAMGSTKAAHDIASNAARDRRSRAMSEQERECRSRYVLVVIWWQGVVSARCHETRTSRGRKCRRYTFSSSKIADTGTFFSSFVRARHVTAESSVIAHMSHMRVSSVTTQHGPHNTTMLWPRATNEIADSYNS